MPQHKETTAAIGLLTGLSLLVAGAETANAGMITQFHNFSLSGSTQTNAQSQADDDSDTETATFDKFDPANGTLTEVKFTLTSTQTGNLGSNVALTLNMSCEGTGCSASTTVTTDYEISVVGASPDPLFADEDAPALSCVNFCSRTATLDESFDGMAAFTDGLTLANFVGAGMTFDVNFALDLQHSLTLSGQINAASSSGGVSWPGTFEVTYTFTEVPEPAGLALFATGLAGFGYLGRRRKKKAGADPGGK